MKAVLSLILMLALQACAAHRVETDSKAPQKNCLSETGSRIERGKQECIPVSGRTYTREELQRSGYSSTAEALRHSMP